MASKTIAEELLYATVRIETEMGSGTGFLFEVPAGGDQIFLALVTNKHVIKYSKKGRFFFTRKKNDGPDIGQRVDVQIASDFESLWYGHPNPNIDVAALPIAGIINGLRSRDNDVYIRTLGPQQMPSAEQLAELDALEEITFVGYPNGQYDKVNLLPIFRRGHTATPVQINYNGEPKFLIDASVFPGSSGSPVLIYDLGGYGTRSGLAVGSRAYFLGIVAAVLIHTATGKLEFQSIPTAIVPVVTTEELMDLGVVYKASTVLETVLGLQKSDPSTQFQILVSNSST